MGDKAGGGWHSQGGDCDEAIQADRSVHCVNNIYSWTSTGTDSDGTLFTEFLAELNASELGGFDDWCIPNIKKLQSIVNYSTIGPASSVPGSTAASIDWSSTTGATDTNFAWSVLFTDGSVGNIDKVSGFHARAVRPCP